MIDYSNIRKGNHCIIWTRVSSKYQEDNGGSLDTQKELCEEYAKTHNLAVTKYFGGQHESAKTPGKLVTEMTAYVKKHTEVATVLISEFDRFSRIVWQATKMLEDMRTLGIIVIAVKYGTGTRTKEGMMMAQQMLSMAQWDNQNRTDKFVGGRQGCLRSGAWCEKAPLGYRKEGKSRNTWCYLNDEGKLLKKAFKWKLGGMSNAEILSKLSMMGLEISKQELHKILVNPFYAGKITHKLINYEMVDGQIEPAVSYPNFLRVQEILSGKTGKYTHKKHSEECPLVKYVLCGEDETPFTAYSRRKNDRVYYYYKCNKIGCKTNVSATEMHNKYEDLLPGYDLSKNMLMNFSDLLKESFECVSKGQEESRSLYKKQLSQLEKNIKTVKTRHAIGEVSNEDYSEIMKDFNERRDEILLNLESVGNNLSNFEKVIPLIIAKASDLRSLWRDGNYETKRKIEYLVYPNGIIWDKKNRSYRTENRNSVFDLLDGFSAGYGNKKRTASNETVPLCG